LHFVQIDEFYPINPRQHNSILRLCKKFYIEGFDLDPEKALLINCEEIPLAGGKNFSEVFPDNIIDLSLRNREAIGSRRNYSRNHFSGLTTGVHPMRRNQGTGRHRFFLGGIGPDGHIAFNTRGSDHNSAPAYRNQF
jgi:glucosamine-6-phosphate deaminase